VTDGRLGIDGLRGLVSNVLRQDVLAGHVFAFCNGRRNRVRCLLFDGSGFWLATKRLERATFDWPKDEAAVAQMSLSQLRLLLEGFELRSRRGWKRYDERLRAGAAAGTDGDTRVVTVRPSCLKRILKQHTRSAKLYTSRSHEHSRRYCPD
jgi:transposase